MLLPPLMLRRFRFTAYATFLRHISLTTPLLPLFSLLPRTAYADYHATLIFRSSRH